MTWKVTNDPVDFDEAEAWFSKRVKMTRKDRETLDEKARRIAFFVSGVAQLDLVNDAWKAVDDAIKKGTTLEDFKRTIGPALEAAWGGTVDNPGWRLETIFRTNIQNAYASGRYEQATNPDILDDRPVWMFDAILDGRETEVCHACDGTKLPAEDEWWRSHNPPLHYNCRSTLITLTETEAGKLTLVKPAVKPIDGFGVTPDDGAAIEQWAAKKAAAAAPPVAAVQQNKMHDPAHWQSAYVHYGDAAETVAYGRAAMERGLDTPIADARATLKKLEAPHQPLIYSIIAEDAQRAKQTSLRDVVLDPNADEVTKARAQMAAMLVGQASQVTTPKKLDVTPKYPTLRKQKQLAKEHLEQNKAFFGTLLASSLNHKVKVFWQMTRAYYKNGEIHTGFDAPIIAHEWGHALEEANPKLLDRAAAFLTARTKFETEQLLSILTGIAAYGPREKAKPDQFFSPYIGKIYESQGKVYATEVTSMGLEALMTADPKARVDLIHLMFTIGQLANR